MKEPESSPDDECESVMEWLCGLLKAGLDCVVISDYGKGMIDDILSQKIIKKANEYNVPVLVDPKGSDWEKYDGAYGITPNLKSFLTAPERASLMKALP